MAEWKKQKLTPEELVKRAAAIESSNSAMGNRNETAAEAAAEAAAEVEYPEDPPRPEGEFWITHYYNPFHHPENGSAEFIRRKSVLKMNISHGLGSGIYGLVRGTDQRVRPALDNMKVLYQMMNPVVIKTDDELSCFTSLSVGLIEACESLVNSDGDPRGKDAILTKLCEDWLNDPKCSSFLNKIVKANPDGKNILTLLHTTVDQWVHDYRNANEGDYLYQPINYFLMGHYDGVYNKCRNGNTFAQGSVFFKPDSHIPREQNSASSHEYKLLPGKKLIEFVPVDLVINPSGGKRKKSKRSKKSNKRRKSIKKRR